MKIASEQVRSKLSNWTLNEIRSRILYFVRTYVPTYHWPLIWAFCLRHPVVTDMHIPVFKKMKHLPFPVLGVTITPIDALIIDGFWVRYGATRCCIQNFDLLSSALHEIERLFLLFI